MKLRIAVCVSLGACVALAQPAAEFHPCRVTGKTMPGAWVVANSGEIAPADEKGRLLFLTPQEVDTDAWYEELKRLLKESNAHLATYRQPT